MSGRKGNYMTVYSGTKYYPLDPYCGEVKIEDIAHSLSNMCRYNGHCKKFYSVAEHSVLVSYLVPPVHALEGLLHDAAEAYTVDLIKPIKMVPSIHRVFSPIETSNEDAISLAFGLTYPWPESIKEADNAVCKAEIKVMMPKSNVLDDLGLKDIPIVDVNIRFLKPKKAKKLFLARYAELSQERLSLM